MTRVEIVEVSPRDGLQNEARIVASADKVELIRRAVAAGVQRIEVASFVDPRRVPQMADAEAVCAGVAGLAATKIGLVLNQRGAVRALATSVDELGAVVSASDGFGIANQGRSSDESVSDAIAILNLARDHGRRAQVTISTAFGCPFDDEVAPARVADIARRLAAARPIEIALADTIGVAAPGQVVRTLRTVAAAIPGMPIRCHFHDTRGTAIANSWAALTEGAVTLDASIGGLGGCPFAPGASGNVATEDLLYALDRSAIETGISLEPLLEILPWLSATAGRSLPSKLAHVPPFAPDPG
ncbi:hydroxymethylglutaryl-CoA lyase [Sphingopyxis sp. 113P3]|uniref:hydroxymethylglutaryl-CoA lyase n=1 Tax=Sphingopyxis sp. (strain 113P3) TaxID=292913 RepID=UPI0006AD152A|nr:hydroxymethylglutaryl-CoA lyase [Sphingopyxis sp. 113P3]ALC11161.1 3-hydroxy-3-methylglutaryl-CoA lyase [Sphingopyxis sp. 113P3]